MPDVALGRILKTAQPVLQSHLSPHLHVIIYFYKLPNIEPSLNI